MKKKYALFILVILNHSLMAQCTGCTTTISTAVSSSYTVTSGNTLCITSTGSVNGNITVDGGALCNEGTINASTVIVKNSGSFNNFGESNISNLRVMSNSYVYNFAHFHLTTFKANSSYIYTYSLFDTDDLVDSATVFVAQEKIQVSNDLVNRDNSTFTQANGDIVILRDFINTNFSTFTVGEDCMIPIMRNFTNDASIQGGGTGSACAGFHVYQITTNSTNGFIGMDGGNLDICDEGHPVGNLDVNTGTISATVTFCTCSNLDCAILVSMEEFTKESVMDIFPNPAQNSIRIELKNPAVISEIKLIDGSGRLLSVNFIKKENGSYTGDISRLANGLYQLILVGEKEIFGKTIIIEH